MRVALTAGSTFAGFVLVGFAIGLLAMKWTGIAILPVAGLLVGVIGGFVSVGRALLRAGK